MEQKSCGGGQPPFRGWLYFIDGQCVVILALFSWGMDIIYWMGMKYIPLLAAVLFSLGVNSQYVQKLVFETSVSVAGYYLAVPPSSATIEGGLVVCCPY